MAGKLRVSLIAVGGLAMLVILALLAIYWAAQQCRPSIARRCKPACAAMEKGSGRMLRKAAALQSALQRPGHWEIRFTAEEINGWLAVDLKKNHPNALPPTLKDPRVGITPTEMTAACRYENGNTASVVSLTIHPYLAENNVVALRIIGARAGLLPLPLERVLQGISQAAREMRFRLEWRRSGGDPVAMVSLSTEDDDKQMVRIEAIRLGEGEIDVSGTTQRRRP